MTDKRIESTSDITEKFAMTKEIDKKDFIRENAVYVNNKQLFDCNLVSINLVIKTLNIFENQNPQFTSDFRKVVQVCFTKSVPLFVSIHFLCNEGYGLEAYILVRALLETVVELKFLEKKISLCSLFLENPEEYENKLKQDKYTIKERAKYGSMEKHYNKRYTDMCKFSHVDYRGVLPKISQMDGNRLIFNIGPSVDFVSTTLLLSAYYFGEIYRYFVKTFELESEDWLNEMQKVSKELGDAVLSDKNG